MEVAILYKKAAVRIRDNICIEVLSKTEVFKLLLLH